MMTKAGETAQVASFTNKCIAKMYEGRTSLLQGLLAGTVGG